MNGALIDWLLEPENASVRYLALRDLLGVPQDDVDVLDARAAIADLAPVRAILDAQYPAGYWIKPDRGYSPRYRATIWQLIFLCDLGATRTDGIARACDHVIGATLRPDRGLFSAHAHSTGIWPCLNGDLLRAFWHFGYGTHPIVSGVASALARRVLADGWICVRNSVQVADKRTWQPCLWGCVKVLRGFAAIPGEGRPDGVHQAIDRGLAFLRSHDLAQEQAPAFDVRSRWLRFGFPLGYGSDLLEALLALTELQAGVEKSALQVILGKRDKRGRWPLESALRRTWADFGVEGLPNKWVTLRALKVLRTSHAGL